VSAAGIQVCAWTADTRSVRHDHGGARLLSRRLLKLKHDRSEMGFLAAAISEEEMGREPFWTLRVESPASTEDFRVHLTDGSSMSLSMITRDGSHLRGEAYVSNISDGADTATVVTLAGTGPLNRS
jgi:hypothetical protein